MPGWENMVHGGIISALLDEVMSWAIMYHKKTFLVTRKMSIKYIRPVPVETPLTAKGRWWTIHTLPKSWLMPRLGIPREGCLSEERLNLWLFPETDSKWFLNGTRPL